MAKIKITIPDNLTPLQELAKIATAINALPAMAIESSKAIGDVFNKKELKTVIEITRKSKAKVAKECSVCKVLHVEGVPLYTNYGGSIRKIATCSKQCADMVLTSVNEDRVSKDRRKLKPFRTWE